MAATMSELLMNSYTKFIGDNNIDLSYIMNRNVYTTSCKQYICIRAIQ